MLCEQSEHWWPNDTPRTRCALCSRSDYPMQATDWYLLQFAHAAIHSQHLASNKSGLVG
jgi:hypothetical protein